MNLFEHIIFLCSVRVNLLNYSGTYGLILSTVCLYHNDFINRNRNDFILTYQERKYNAGACLKYDGIEEKS